MKHWIQGPTLGRSAPSLRISLTLLHAYASLELFSGCGAPEIPSNDIETNCEVSREKNVKDLFVIQGKMFIFAVAIPRIDKSDLGPAGIGSPACAPSPSSLGGA